MKVAVMGAGAVGCYYGAMLARAGHEVVLIGRAQHVQAVERDGLRLQTRQFDERIGPPRIRASVDPAAVAGAQLVLFCVKSPDTESAGASIGPHLAADALVLALQNGVDNAERLRGAIAQEVAAAVVYVATEMAGPGHVRPSTSTGPGTRPPRRGSGPRPTPRRRRPRSTSSSSARSATARPTAGPRWPPSKGRSSSGRTTSGPGTTSA